MDNKTKLIKQTALFADFCHQLNNDTIWQDDTEITNDQTGEPAELPINAMSGKPYQSINAALLLIAAQHNNFGSAEWATFKQWYAKNETIRKGEKGTVITRYIINKQTYAGNGKNAATLKLVRVFNRCQLKSWQPDKSQAE